MASIQGNQQVKGSAGYPPAPPPLRLPFSVDVVMEEVLGPFTSWGNAKTTYGAVGNGVADDTVAIQTALTNLGKAGQPQVLYFPPGTYNISSQLTLNGLASASANPWGGVKLIGDAAATTKIQWVGASGGAMLLQNGGFATSYSRLTWDGGGLAQYGVAQWYNTTAGVQYGGSAEHQDEVFQNMAIGVMGGRMGTGYGQLDSEGQIRRCSFINCTYAGFDTGSFNALDWWLWDCSFINCARGLSNTYSIGNAGQVTGAGAFYVYRSYFSGSTVADMAISNTGWFSAHQNVSIGSAFFFLANPLGVNAAVIILKGNRVVNGTNASAISLGNLGPLMMVDNQFSTTGSPVTLADFNHGYEIVSIGNQYTGTLPAGNASDRITSVGDATVLASSISIVPPTLPNTPTWSTHQIFEVASGSTPAQIQAVIASALASGDPLPIVHFAAGTWAISTPLVVGAGQTVQFVGDGYGSLLTSGAGTTPVFSLQAPCKVRIRDMQFLGANATWATITNADTSGGRIQVVGSALGPLSAANLTQTALSLQANFATTTITLSNVLNAISISQGVTGTVTLTNGSKLVMCDTWYEGPLNSLFNIVSGNFSYLGGHCAPGATNPTVPVVVLNNLVGTAVWLGMQLDLANIPAADLPALSVAAENSQSNAYFMGLTSNAANYFNRTAGSAGAGTVGYISNETWTGTATAQAANQYSTSSSNILSAWLASRSIAWDTVPYDAPQGVTDVKIYRTKADQTLGISITG